MTIFPPVFSSRVVPGRMPDSDIVMLSLSRGEEVEAEVEADKEGVKEEVEEGRLLRKEI